MNIPLLAHINAPADLRQLSCEQLPQLCDELRTALIETVAQTGGHLASGLGVVELTIALHYVFNTPEDHLIWDIGHQAYPHKMLTGRREQLQNMRQMNGISGFPNRGESVYDVFGVGHASTSLSALLGMYLANQRAGRDVAHIAVIGDGAMTAGMAFEALHHIARENANMLIILNDNGMSISANVEGFSAHTTSQNDTNALLGKAFFESLSFDYTEIHEGNDVAQLVTALKTFSAQTGPQLLHIHTQKGKGYAPAEANPIAYHGVAPFNSEQGLPNIRSQGRQDCQCYTFTQIFSQWLLDTAERDERLMAITPAMREGSGLVEFSQRFPEHYIDVGIAEQHALTLAAGMACQGAKPVVAIYSTFLQRAYDQFIHDIALQNLSVLFAVDRAGVVGEDGATHAGAFDIAFLRAVPNVIMMTPSDEAEMYALLNTGYAYQGSAVVRYPKASGSLNQAPKPTTATLPIGKAHLIRQGEDLAILVFGTLLSHFRQYAQAHDATLVDMRFVKPLDTDLLAQLAQTHERFIVVEEGSLQGGIGEHVAQYLQQMAPQKISVRCLGIEDEFVLHGKRDEVLARCGLSLELS